MGFFDKAKDIAEQGMNAVDKAALKAVQKATDSQLKEMLSKHPNNKHAIAEAKKRGL
jgi:hypothetical protein